MQLTDRERQTMINDLEFLATTYRMKSTLQEKYDGPFHLALYENYVALAAALREDRVKFEAVA